jgi:glycosyltransferase involved in cell wall biosynthesis
VTPPPAATTDEMAHRADRSGIRRIHLFAFRDRDDPGAGGSEEHVNQVCRQLVAAGREVTLHTGRITGGATDIRRDGYRVVRRGGQLGVFATSVLDERSGRLGTADGIVEIFHGVPFFAPLWSRLPQVGFVHHVHLGTWHHLLPTPLAQVGHLVEAQLVPRVYRHRALVTAAASARDEIVEHYGAAPGRITIAPHGIDPRFRPGGERSSVPLALAVARLMPQKGVEALIPALIAARTEIPDLEAVIVGDGPLQPRIESLVADAGAGAWLHLAGRVDDDALVSWYRRAWVACSASEREGFGLTLTEAAACGTPAVATRIPGHLDAVDDGTSGLLVDGPAAIAPALVRLLSDDHLRHRLARGALAHAQRFSWEAAAAGVLDALCDEADRQATAGPRRGRRRRARADGAR